MAIKTRYVPRNPAKYKGDPTKIICRSLWERRFAKYCDDTPGILHWSSEEVVIPYVKPTDGRVHRYFVDFWIEVQSTSGLKRFLIEVKPKSQTAPPKKKRQTRRYLAEVMTFATNKAKWQAADEYCRQRGWTFLVLTEDHLFGGKVQ